MLLDVPSTRVRSGLKGRVVATVPTDSGGLLWLNYELFLRRLSKLAAENAKAEKSSVIRKHHVEAARRKILTTSRG